MWWGHRTDVLASYGKYALLYVGPLFASVTVATGGGLEPIPWIVVPLLTWAFGLFVLANDSDVDAYAERTVYGARVTAIPVPGYRSAAIKNGAVVDRWDWFVLRPVDVALLAGMAGLTWCFALVPIIPPPIRLLAIVLVYAGMGTYAQYAAGHREGCEERVSFRKP